jgi:hypothetical protein
MDFGHKTAAAGRRRFGNGHRPRNRLAIALANRGDQRLLSGR